MRSFILNNAQWIKNYILLNFPINEEFYEKHKKHISWELISQNVNTHFGLDFIEAHEDQIIWDVFNPLNSSYFDDDDDDVKLMFFLDKYKEKLNWDIVSSFLGKLERPIEVLKKFYDYWDWSYLSSSFSIPWDKNMIIEFRNVVDWTGIVFNPNLDWTYEMLEEFEDEIDWLNFYQGSNYFWDYRSIIRFSTQLENLGVSIDNLLHNVEHPEEFKEKNKRRKNLIRLFFENQELINLQSPNILILKNFDDAYDLIKSLPSLEGINFKRNLKWSEEAFSYLLSCEKIDILHLSTYTDFIDPFISLKMHHEKLIWYEQTKQIVFNEKKEEKMIDLPMGISANGNIMWTCEMLDEFTDKINWQVISNYGSFEWTPELIKKHFHRFDKEEIFTHPSLYDKIIYPSLDEELFNKVIAT
jgi:hypothetical protein